MKTKRFTLVELLVVLAIVGIIIGISLPAFKNMILGSGFTYSSTLISKTFLLSRQEAIAKRKMVAVVFPELDSGCTEIVPVYVKRDSGDFVFAFEMVNGVKKLTGYIPNQKIIQLSNSGVVTAIEYLEGTAWKPATTAIKDIPWTDYSRAYTTAEKAIIFKPAMGIRSSDGDADIRVTLSDSVKNGASVIQKSTAKIYLRVNCYTGRVEITEGT